MFAFVNDHWRRNIPQKNKNIEARLWEKSP